PAPRVEADRFAEGGDAGLVFVPKVPHKTETLPVLRGRRGLDCLLERCLSRGKISAAARAHRLARRQSGSKHQAEKSSDQIRSIVSFPSGLIVGCSAFR